MRNFHFHQHLWQVLVAAITLVLLSERNCQAIRLNPNGGYDIVIGVEENTPEPMNVKNFLDEIRLGAEQFSTELWKATHRRFFINSVDILVPGNWWTVSNFDTATWQTLHGSEVRISHDVAAPNVVNPNSCGTSGLHVELPDTFFKVPRGGQYGPVGKAMVNLWARYRFGVWEEHGIPGDTKFPYFYAQPSFEPRWEATGCSNEEIDGSFMDIDGDISEQCDAYGSESPTDNCRFIPSPSNTANSSLMHLHWMESVTEFCDSKTHNYAAPNRQNLFCGHRSVWEVIRESDDYKSTKTCMDSVERPQFRVLKESRSPEFYILMDRGRTVTPDKVLQEVMGALVRFVSFPSLERVNIAIGTYPHANKGRDHYYVKEEVGWAPISSVIYDIERVLEESSNPDGPVIRDFGLAIQEVAEKIKQRNHMAGTVILIVKRGASPNLFDKITYEQEVIASIKEDSRIQVFAIEAQQGDRNPFTNLQTLVKTTNGQYHLINDTVNTARKLEPILSEIQEKLEQSSIMNSLSSWTIQKQYTYPDKAIEIPIYDNANTVKVHLITNKQMVASDIYLEQLSGEHATVQLIEKGEWDENSDLSRRIVFTYTINNPTPDSVWSLRHGCHSEKLGECRFFLIVTAHNDRPTPRTSEFMFNSQSISIDISTSAAEQSYVDMSDQGFKIVPFAIYAKIEMDQQRVLGLRNVTALIRLGGEHDNHLGDWTVPLADDGTGLPDIFENDGIYSGIFTPLENGLYQISVAADGVSDPSGVSTFQDLRIVNHAGSLMQINQQSFGCKNSSKPRCISAVPRGSFSRVQDIRRTVAVENAGTFKPGKPTKILDFTVKALPNFHVEFEFTSPELLGSDQDPEEFRIYMAPHVDNFIGSTDLTKLLIQQIGQPSGTRVKIPFNAAEKAIPFYAVEAVYGGQKGGPSNVVGVVPSEYGEVLPSPTTTTSTPPTVTSTGPTTTVSTDIPWPSTTPTTESPYPTTTEESEETDEPIDPSTSTTVSPTTSTTEGSATSSTSTTPSTPTTTEDFSTTTVVPSTTDDFGVTGISSTTTTASPSTTTEDSGATGSSTTSTTEVPITSTDDSGVTGSSTSTTTEAPSTTTEDSGVTGSSTSTTTEVPSTTTDDSGVTGSSTSTTQAPSTTTEDSGVTGSSTSTTTEVPSTTTEDSGVTGPSTSTTTEVPSTTTEDSGVTGSSTSTTQAPSTTTDDSGVTGSSTSTTTELPSTTTEDSGVTGSSTSTTQAPSTTTEDSGVTGSSTSTTTESPSTTTEDSGVTGSSTSTTTEAPSTTTENSGTTSGPSTPSTTESPSSTTEDSGVTGSSSTTTEPSTSTSTEAPSTTTEDSGVTGSSTSTTTSPSTTTDSDVSSTTSTTEQPETSTTIVSTTSPSSTTGTSISTSTTPSPSSSTPDEDVSIPSTTVSPSSTTTPEPPSSSLSTSEQASSSATSSTEPISDSASAKATSSETLLSILLLSIMYFRIQSW